MILSIYISSCECEPMCLLNLINLNWVEQIHLEMMSVYDEEERICVNDNKIKQIVTTKLKHPKSYYASSEESLLILNSFSHSSDCRYVVCSVLPFIIREFGKQLNHVRKNLNFSAVLWLLVSFRVRIVMAQTNTLTRSGISYRNKHPDRKLHKSFIFSPNLRGSLSLN